MPLSAKYSRSTLPSLPMPLRACRSVARPVSSFSGKCRKCSLACGWPSVPSLCVHNEPAAAAAAASDASAAVMPWLSSCSDAAGAAGACTADAAGARDACSSSGSSKSTKPAVGSRSIANDCSVLQATNDFRYVFIVACTHQQRN